MAVGMEDITLEFRVRLPLYLSNVIVSGAYLIGREALVQTYTDRYLR